MRLFWLISLCLLCAAAHADVPTAAQDCRNRNAARCEVNGVTFEMDGACPAQARTLRPAGTENCTAVETSIPSNRISPPPAVKPTTGNEPPRWMRRLIAVASGLAVLVMVAAVGYGLSRQPLRTVAGGVAIWGIALIFSVWGAYVGAGWVFRRVFNSFDNHDSAAPALLAMPLAGLTFLLVLGILTPVLALLLRTLAGKIRTRKS